MIVGAAQLDDLLARFWSASYCPTVALALFARATADDDARSLVLEHAVERNAPWALEAQLEKVLVAPLQADHREARGGARSRLEATGGSW